MLELVAIVVALELMAGRRETWLPRRWGRLRLGGPVRRRFIELIGLTCGDLRLGAAAHLSCIGKGRKQRITPLTRQTVNRDARLADQVPKIRALLEAAEDDLLAFMAFPAAYRTKLRSTNSLERVNREIARRDPSPTDVSATRSPDVPALLDARGA